MNTPTQPTIEARESTLPFVMLIAGETALGWVHATDATRRDARLAEIAAEHPSLDADALRHAVLNPSTHAERARADVNHPWHERQIAEEANA